MGPSRARRVLIGERTTAGPVVVSILAGGLLIGAWSDAIEQLGYGTPLEPFFWWIGVVSLTGIAVAVGYYQQGLLVAWITPTVLFFTYVSPQPDVFVARYPMVTDLVYACLPGVVCGTVGYAIAAALTALDAESRAPT